MRVFIIRPFGCKEEINFDRVEAELIQPALTQLRQYGMFVAGSTTGLITRQGNIREDMFRLIAVADLVIADVSIHNANVFYELGMRHALKPRHTLLIRSGNKQAYPFDLQTDRYFAYDSADPQASLAGLVQALRSTLAASDADSPMFKLLPGLAPHGRGKLVRVPTDFAGDVERARIACRPGELRLFASEVQSFEWDQEGLRLIGDAQFKLRAYAGARDTFELLCQADGDNIHANLRLGTIYQRLAMLAPAHKAELLANSELAIQRVLQARPTAGDRVEAYCLLASNDKTRWIDELAGMPPEKHRAATLRSAHFSRMLRNYLVASNIDLNAHYPAINALALLKVQIELAESLPEEWDQLHDSEAGALAATAAAKKLAGHLGSTLCLALELDELMGQRQGSPDPWASSSRADYLLLTAGNRVGPVEKAYLHALTGADWFTLEATRRNLDIYKNLGLFEPRLSAALNLISTMDGAGKPSVRPEKVLMFTGHMIDAPDKPRGEWRFPRSAEATARARALIAEAVRKETAGHEHNVLGIAGGACGGDILFHEVCAELGVPTAVYLALPVDKFEVSSVQRGGAEWIERYRALTRRLTPQVLQQGEALPKWLTEKPDYNLWVRNNLWMMFCALSAGASDHTLIALYNREREPEGPGGTAHLLEEARLKGFKPVELDAGVLLEGLR